MARSRRAWAQVNLGRASTLVLGWRQGTNLKAGRLQLGSDMDRELRNRAHETLSRIGTRSARSYEHSAQLEDDEVFLLTASDLPTKRPRLPKRRQAEDETTSTTLAQTEEERTSALLNLLNNPYELDPLPADDIRGRSFLFYAAVFTTINPGPIAFVKQFNPGVVLKTGRVFGMLGQTVTRVEDPILVFEPDFDLVIDQDEIASLAPNAIMRLFADVEIAAAAVPDHVDTLAALPIALSEAVQTMIISACSQRRTLARRLELLVQQPHIATLTVAEVKQYLRRLKVDPRRFVRGNEIVVSESDVSELLDVLDQKNYRGGYDDLLRRADRTSLVGD